MKKRLSILNMAGLIWSMGAIAGSEPVSWTLYPSTGFSNSKWVYYKLTNNLPIATNILIEKVSTGGSFGVLDLCKYAPVQPGKSCYIFIGFKPQDDGESSFSLIYGYHNKRIPLPTLVVASSAPHTSTFFGEIVGLPSTIYTNNTTNFSIVYTNTGDTQLTGCIAPQLSNTGPATTSSREGSPPCGETLDIGDSCILNATVTGNSTTAGVVNIQSTMACNGPISAHPQASTYGNGQAGCDLQADVTLPLPSITHKYSDNVVMITFTNQCQSAMTMTDLGVNATGVTPTTVTISDSLSDCTGILGGGESCHVYASIIPQDTGPLMVTASAKSQSGASVEGYTSDIVKNPKYYRNLTMAVGIVTKFLLNSL